MIASDTSVQYTVQRGDWLSKIAPRYGESWQKLYKDNREIVGDNPDLIYPGTVLNVRPGGTRVTVTTGSAVSSTAESVSLPRTTRGAVAVAYARTKIGSHYRWGATGPSVFDCSGLVVAAWRHAGVKLPRTANQMWHGLPRVSLRHLRVGDIIAFGYRSSYADHVGLYAGHGLIIDTSSHRSGGGVGIQSLKSRTGGGAWHALGAVRPGAASSTTAKRAARMTLAAYSKIRTTSAASAGASGSISALISRIFGSQAACAANIIKRESGFRVTAYNPSGAFGLPQALPGSKMASAGADWATNPVTQLRWMVSYVNSRYGGACHAWSFWEAHSAY
ncbi:aggregation-promoting factor C-terminal-like domain-containing protein [Streptomyces mirabilis]|uniref:aggregation-promoting factor C-terminal-like domain-containing protein n=1 Tax=Streptomyces mirabilis TaxID=68239 RepID=UPI0036B91186